jgi:hypothetical protein
MRLRFIGILAICAGFSACVDADPPEPAGPDISALGKVCTTNTVSKVTCNDTTTNRAKPSAHAESG